VARDTNFYYSFLVLSADKRRAIVAVWDFCRAVDDAADEPGEAAPADALAVWRRELSACYGDGTPTTPQGRHLAPVVRQFELSRAPFEAVIEGVEMDLGDRRYETFDALYEYCIRVASAVGHVCIEIFGCRDEAARRYATDRGVALQLTNILRDVGGDLSRGRIYLPLDEMRAYGVTEADLRAEVAHAGHGVRSAAVRRLLQAQAKRAREFYASAERAMPPGEARSLVAAEVMAAIYKAILDGIEARDYDVFSTVVRIPRPRRAGIAAATWLRNRFR
jgi:15-cis-phytoene synthase